MKKARTPVAQARPSNLPATSKTHSKANQPFTADLDPDFLDTLRSLAPEARKIIGPIITQVCNGFGTPHDHGGFGIRALGNGFYECRKGLKTRLIFERVNPKNLYFHAVGNHDGVKHFLKRHATKSSLKPARLFPVPAGKAQPP